MTAQIIATVDATKTKTIIWWTNIRPERTASMARNCGAWELYLDDVESIRTATDGKICLATPLGHKMLQTVSTATPTFLNANATLANVLGEQHRLEIMHASSKNKTAAKPLLWQPTPESLNFSQAKQPAAPKDVQRALGIADWLVELAEFWESVEQVRLSRPNLRKVDGPEIRPLPLVLEAD